MKYLKSRIINGYRIRLVERKDGYGVQTSDMESLWRNVNELPISFDEAKTLFESTCNETTKKKPYKRIFRQAF
jgi:hypothetical protein